MMQLSQYISTLLYRYECIIVPGLGAFLTHKVSAEIDTQAQVFSPPKKRLSFNEQLQSNDGVLANYIATSEKVSYENALSKIAKQVAEIQQSLKKNETVSLKYVGDLSRSKTGALEFEPSYHLNYMTAAFGLSQFVSPEVKRDLPLKVVGAKEKETTLILASRKSRTNALIKYAAVAVILLGLGGFMASNAYMQYIEKENIAAQEKVRVALDNQIQEATFLVNTPLPAITIDIEKPSGNYHIVAGAFRVKANSERKLRQLKRLGFNARLIGQNRFGLHQVVFESYPERRAAERALYNIRRTQDPTAWLLIKSVP
tara:strand:+ start:4612 stop:5553 length:942 start_codon:yes stop_codon:yes gene_type:complete